MRITNLSVVVLDEIKPLVIAISHFLTKTKRFQNKDKTLFLSSFCAYFPNRMYVFLIFLLEQWMDV